MHPADSRRSLPQRWRRLSGRDRRDLARLAWQLPLVNLALHAFGTRRTRRWLLRRSEPGTSHDPTHQQLQRSQRLAALAAALGRRGRHQTSCLRQALAVEYTLRREGLAAELRLGTRKTSDGHLQAHAWVELQGQALAQQTLPYQAVADATHHLR